MTEAGEIAIGLSNQGLTLLTVKEINLSGLFGFHLTIPKKKEGLLVFYRISKLLEM